VTVEHSLATFYLAADDDAKTMKNRMLKTKDFYCAMLCIAWATRSLHVCPLVSIVWKWLNTTNASYHWAATSFLSASLYFSKRGAY